MTIVTTTVVWNDDMSMAPRDRNVLLWWPVGGFFEAWSAMDFGRWEYEEYHKNPKPHWAGNSISRTWGVRRSRELQPTYWAEVEGPLS